MKQFELTEEELRQVGLLTIEEIKECQEIASIGLTLDDEESDIEYKLRMQTLTAVKSASKVAQAQIAKLAQQAPEELLEQVAEILWNRERKTDPCWDYIKFYDFQNLPKNTQDFFKEGSREIIILIWSAASARQAQAVEKVRDETIKSETAALKEYYEAKIKEAVEEAKKQVIEVIKDIEYFTTDEFCRKYPHIKRDDYFGMDMWEVIEQALKGEEATNE